MHDLGRRRRREETGEGGKGKKVRKERKKGEYTVGGDGRQSKRHTHTHLLVSFRPQVKPLYDGGRKGGDVRDGVTVGTDMEIGSCCSLLRPNGQF